MASPIYKKAIEKTIDNFNLDVIPIYLKEKKKNFFDTIEDFKKTNKNEDLLYIVRYKDAPSSLRFNILEFPDKGKYYVYTMELPIKASLEEIYEELSHLIFLDRMGKYFIEDKFYSKKLDKPSKEELIKFMIYSEFIADLGIDYLNDEYESYFGKRKFNRNLNEIKKDFLKYYRNFKKEDYTLFSILKAKDLTRFLDYIIPKIVGQKMRKDLKVDYEKFPEYVFYPDISLVNSYLEKKKIKELLETYVDSVDVKKLEYGAKILKKF